MPAFRSRWVTRFGNEAGRIRYVGQRLDGPELDEHEQVSEAVVECVPNFSEGTDVRRVEAIVSAMRTDGVRLLDWSMDADHNR